MRSLFLILAVSALAGCGGSSSTTNTESTQASSNETQTTAGGEQESLTLMQFAAVMTEGTVAQVCGDAGAFTRRCFTVDDATCARAFGLSMQGCAEHGAELQLPEIVTEANAEATATTLAQCAGQTYAMGLNQAEMMLQTPECQPNAAN
jgi:hypothetical protein